ncbi:40S ribosomal protein S29 [Plasmodium ovale curtisi]|uniref:40S ribosomal protein S29 n=1 Tax=Plasmodium ovale curtisi TaxID=864141 RepID=A0A1A8VKT2_PLAOA|nr:40S ribosomal protein S29 [Plasmodium ovale curtisi]SBS80323.1 40S ribosomal protein S29 [Plasmodium ovale curtisi]
MGCIQNVHPKKYGQGSRQCRVCSNRHAIIRKYNINICRQCFRERADIIGFKKIKGRPTHNHDGRAPLLLD